VIGYVAGEVVYRLASGAVVVDVNGVGYEVHVASPEPLPVGESVRLVVHTVVRDDAILLYGFTSLEQREFFELLLATPGVGPSTALGALRTMSTERLAAAIEGGDTALVAQVPGIGPKTAARIVLELKGKLVLPADSPGGATGHAGAIEDALRALGYTSGEIRDALDGVELPADESAALREALTRVRRP